MRRTLLLGDSSVSWRGWLKSRLDGRDFLCLDPAEPAQSPPGRLTLHRGEKIVAWRFYGSLDPIRAPHVAVAALSELLAKAGDDAVILLPTYRAGPLFRNLIQLAAELVQPAEILISKGVDLDQQGFPVGPQGVELEEAFPDLVRHAQRKAQWIKLLEDSSSHEIELASVTIEGTRLGSGRAMKSPLEGVDHLEACGPTLLIVGEKHPEDRDLARLLDASHCSRAHFVQPESYVGLLCSFARQSGEDFGMGAITEINFKTGLVKAACTAIPPAPVRILRIGGLQIDPAGNELGEVRPWQV